MTFDELWEILQHRQEQQQLISISLSGKQPESVEPAVRQTIRPVVIRDQHLLQWTCQDERKRQTHQNLDWESSLIQLQSLLGLHYRNAHIRMLDEELQVRVTKNQQPQVRRHRLQNSQPVSIEHDQPKGRLFQAGTPVPFLVELGIMSTKGLVHRSRQKKFRQINRFAEFIHDLRDRFPKERPVRIVDYGCGKSYLTFAVRELLVNQLKLSVDIQAFDSNEDVISTCEQTRRKLDYQDMQFQVANISEAEIEGPIDLAIWLHACDTATDDALARSIQLEAEIILAVPCCQHELFPQLANESLEPMLKHGILRERLASLTTDALRAQYLEACGYKAQVMEFIDLEHTAKNLLIRAIRSKSTEVQRQKALESFQEMKQSLGVKSFHLERACPSR